MKDKKTEIQINKKDFYRNLTRLALPIALQSLMLASVAAGDALMLGKVAQDEMTAVSLATQIQFVQNMFLMAITGAGAILGAQYWGKGDEHTLEDVFNMMLRFCGFVSVLFFLACELMPEMLMHIFTHDAPLIALGSSYLRIAGWSYLLTGVSQCYLTIGSCRTRRPDQFLRRAPEHMPECRLHLRTVRRSPDAGQRRRPRHYAFPCCGTRIMCGCILTIILYPPGI